jgi:uncharacterized protein
MYSDHASRRGSLRTKQMLGSLMAASLIMAPGGALAAGAGAQPTKAAYGVIFQVDQGGQGAIKKTLNNIRNILNDPRFKGRKLRVELIANSKGFAVYVKGNGFEKELRQLKADGVELAQCANTLRELHVDQHDLYGFITVVPSGMGEIVIREAQGWAYIHPSAPPSNQL